MPSKKNHTPPAPKHTPTDATREDVIDGATRLLHRLSRHLDSLENHEIGAVDDVASVLRTIAVRGAGDEVVHRLCRMTNAAQPQVFVSQPAKDDQHVLLAIGAIPTSPNTTTMDHQPPMWMDFDRWANSTALIIRGGQPRRVNSSSDVITAHANTFGSHLGGTIPRTLAETSTVHSRRQNLGEYLIHCAGIVAESALTQALTAAEGQAIVVPQEHRRLGPLIGVVLKHRPDGESFVEVSTGDTGVDQMSDNLLMAHLNEMYIIVGIEIKNKKQDVTFQWELDKPDNWPD